MISPSITFYDNSLGGTRPRRHVAPQIRPAGLLLPRDGGTAAALTSDYPEGNNNNTTNNIINIINHKKFELGRSTRHTDLPIDEEYRHGIKYEVKDGARGCLQPTDDRMSALVAAQREGVYASAQRRPLGHAPIPKYKINTPREGFGVATDKSESVRRVVYGGREMEILHPAGARLERGYDWESVGIDPTQHRFGKSFNNNNNNNNNNNGAGVTSENILHETRHTTAVLPKLVEDYKATARPELGKSRSYGFHNDKFQETAEQRAVRRGGPGDGGAVRELLTSWAMHPATLRAQEEEKAAQKKAEQLKNINGGNTTTTMESTGDIKNDSINEGEGSDTLGQTRSRYKCTFSGKQRGRTVALTELDDDARVPHLLYPCHYVQMGVKSEYFAGGRNLEDIRDLCKKVGFELSDGQIDEVFASIAYKGKCGIEQFKNKAVEMGYLA